MKPYRPHIWLLAGLLLAGMAGPVTAETAPEKPVSAPTPDSADKPRAPRLYYLEADSLDEETPIDRQKKLLIIEGEELEKLQLDAAEEALDALEELQDIDGLVDLLYVPSPADEIILPDTVYTIEITIGPDHIEFYDTTGEHVVIHGRPVTPDLPFIITDEGIRPRTFRRATDIVQVGTNVVIEKDERVEGHVVVFGGNIKVLGQVKGDVVAILGDVNVDGYVHGHAVAPTGTVRISSNGVVRKDVAASIIEDQPGSRIGGKKQYTGVTLPGGEQLWRGVHLTIFLFQIGLAIFLIFLILLAHVFAGERIAAIKSGVVHAGFRSFGMGLLIVTLGIPILFVLLLITVIGIPVALLVLPIAVVISCVLGYAAYGLFLGGKLLGRGGMRSSSQLGRTLAGTAAMLLLLLIGSALTVTYVKPLQVIGWVIFGIAQAIGLVAVLTGLGALVLTHLGTRPRNAHTSPGTPTPPPSALSQEAALGG